MSLRLKHVREAGRVVCLLVWPGEGRSLCHLPMGVEGGEGPAPGLVVAGMRLRGLTLFFFFSSHSQGLSTESADTACP